MSSLSAEINETKKKVHTTDMKMSIGELINLYKDGEIIIDPEFQRLFVWENSQKSKFIESILIGIPIPSIFVQQRNDGIWEVIDGLQRLSTIFEFVGILKNPDGGMYLPLKLNKTKFLPNLKDVYYDGAEGGVNAFDLETKLLFKRFPLNIVVIKRESDETAKYELFDRLNSGGTKLQDQQIRNAVFITENPEAVKLIKRLSGQENFVGSVKLSDKDIKEAYDNELVLRFFAYTNIADRFRDYNDSIKDFLDGCLTDHFKSEDVAILEDSFNKFFNFICNNISDKAFLGKSGGFSIAKFEAITIGINPYKDVLENNKDFFENKINNLQDEEWFKDAMGKKPRDEKGKISSTGNYARRRLPIFIENKKYFNPNSNA